MPLRIFAGWWKFPDGFSIDPVLEDGSPAPFVMAEVGGLVTAPEALAAEIPPEPVHFVELADLIGYSLNGTQLILQWRSTGEWFEAWKVFAFALDGDYPGEHVVAQGDAAPAFPTWYWRPGDIFTTVHDLLIDVASKPGRYPLYVGWYTPDYPRRLTVSHPNAIDNAYRLTTIEVRGTS